MVYKLVLKQLKESRENDDEYHLGVHDDLYHMSGSHRMYNRGAANYYSRGNTEAAEHYYNDHVMPVLRQHKFPERSKPGYLEFQAAMKEKWKHEK